MVDGISNSGKKNAYDGTLNLNKRKGKKNAGKISENSIMRTNGGGVKIEGLGGKSKLIAEVLNVTAEGQKDRVIDSKELEIFWTKLLEFAKDDTLGGREAKKLLKDYGLDKLGIKKEDLFKFINDIVEQMDESGLESCDLKKDDAGNIVLDSDGNPIVVMKYAQDEDGSQTVEEFYTNGDVCYETLDSNVITRSYCNSNGYLKRRESSYGDVVSTTYYTKLDDDGNPTDEVVLDENDMEVPQKTIRKDSSIDETIVTSYENGVRTTEHTTRGETFESESMYVTDENGVTKPLLKKKVENKGLPNVSITTYEYDENNNLKTKCNSQNGVNTNLDYRPDGTELCETVEDTINQVDKQFDYDEEGNYKSTVVYHSTGETRTSSVNANNYLLEMTQDYNEGEETYTITYDGMGHTEGIVVQFEETPAKMAKTFGCDVKELVELNGGKKAFTVGAKVKLPKQVTAVTALKGRDTSEQAVAKYKQWKAEQDAKRAVLQAECDARVTIESYRIDPYIRESRKLDFSRAYVIASYLYKLEGETQVTRSQLDMRTQQLIDANPDKFDENGKLKNWNGNIHTFDLKLPVTPEFATKAMAEVTRKSNNSIMADELGEANDGRERAEYLSKHSHGTKEFLDTMNHLESKEIVGFLESRYFKEDSFVEYVRDAGILTDVQKNQCINRCINLLRVRSNELGLLTINNELLNSININSKTEDIEKVFDKVVTNIRSIEVIPPSERAAAVDRIKKAQLNANDISGVQTVGKYTADQAENILIKREEVEDFFGKSYKGLKYAYNLFGGSAQTGRQVTKEIAEFRQSLKTVNDAYENAIKAGKSEADATVEFNKAFKREFGTECDPKVLKQYSELTERISIAAQIEYAQNHFRNHEKLKEANLREVLKNYFKDDKGNIIKDPITQKPIESEEFLQSFDNMSKTELNNCINGIVNNLRAHKSDSHVSLNELYMARDRVAKNLFGDRDVAIKAFNYANDQQKGAGYVKMGVKVVTAIAVSVATGGAGLPMTTLAVAGSSLMIDAGNMAYLGATGREITRDMVIDSLKEAVIAGAFVGVGGTMGASLMEGLEGSSAVIKGITMVAADTGLGAFGELVMTGEVTVEGTLFYAALSAAGQLILVPKTTTNTKTESVPNRQNSKPNVLDVATNNGQKSSGGKLNSEKFTVAQEQTKAILQDPVTTPERAAMIRQEGRLLQDANRVQGRTIENTADHSQNVVKVGGELKPIETADEATLMKMKKQVEGWSESNPDKQTLLEAINKREVELRNGSEISTVKDGSEYVQNVRDNMSNDATRVIEETPKSIEKAIGPTDAARLRDNMYNNLKTPEKVDAFIKDVQDAVGYNADGSMKVKMVNGKDHAAALIREAQTYKAQLQGRQATRANVENMVNNAKNQKKGLSGNEQVQLDEYIASASEEELQSLLNLVKGGDGKPKLRGGASIERKITNRLNNEFNVTVQAQPAGPAEPPAPRVTEQPAQHPAEPPAPSPASESKPVASTEKTGVSEEFNSKLEKSGVYKTAKDQGSVDRLGGKKRSDYTKEFDDLCRAANTHEELDILEATAKRYRGQAETDSFNASIARRRAELNAKPAGPAEPPAPSPASESKPVASTEKTGVSEEFNSKLEKSGVYKTAKDQGSVDRLGGKKRSDYTKEFDDLCRAANTHEELDILEATAKRYRGQAETDSFNASIARRRAELNAKPAGPAELPTSEVNIEEFIPTES